LTGDVVMPVNFLTSEQEARYGQYVEEPTTEQLAKYFWLDDQDKKNIYIHRGNHNRLGYAIQLGTVRFLGTFLSDPTAIPDNIKYYIAQQLQLDPSSFDKYRLSESRWNHTREIRNTYGYHDFTEQPYHFRLIRWLFTRAWLTAERPSILFDLATAKCVENKILLPGVSVLTRLVSQIRDRSSLKLWSKLSNLPDNNQLQLLEKLLEVDSSTQKSNLEILRQSPIRLTSNGIIKAIDRLETIRILGASQWDISGIPIGRIRTLARYSSMTRAQTIKRMSRERRIATLTAFAIVFTVSSQDDVIDMAEKFLSELFTKSNRKGQKKRLRTLKDLDKAARKLREVCAMILDESNPSYDIRTEIFSKISKDDLTLAVKKVDLLTKSPDHNIEFEELFRNFTTIRRFLPKLMKAIEFQATSAGQPVIMPWNFLKDMESNGRKNKFKNAPTVGISSNWNKVVIKGSVNKVNPCAYNFWAVKKMIEGIKTHDIYVADSAKYGDPREQLLQGTEWDAIRPQILRTLNWHSSADDVLRILSNELHTVYMNTEKRWNSNPSVRIETFAGQERLVLSPLDKLAEPKSLKILRKRVQSLLPHTDLPELLIEICRWTSFTNAFTHISEANSRINDLDISICAVLISQACNIGLSPVVQPGIPALEYDRLTWVEQNYFRTETLSQANSALVDYHSKLNLSKIWGGGEVASADGLRFVTPVKSINSGSNPKYFGTGRGVTYYNFTSDQFTGFHGIVIPGTIRDSLYLLEGILEQQSNLKPREIMTDTAGYSDMIFGLFGLLGYQFSPRLADIGSSRFWRMDREADYGVLNNLARNRIRKDVISRYWDDMLRVAGSLKLGTVNPTYLIQMLQKGGKPTMLGRAIGEFGRIYKTKYLLTYLDDSDYRRRILTQLNRGESRHSLARAVFYGKRGELHQSYREGQEDQLGALGLVVNAIVIWNTKYMEIALDAINAAGQPTHGSDIQRLSPLGYEHINIMGKYSFILPEEIEHGGLRSLLSVDKITNDIGERK
jgi:TnpA family transposase